MSKVVYILNGPNLNLLGKREPQTYGYDSLDDVEALCRLEAERCGLEVRLLQSNAEAQLIDWIHEARESACGIIFNPAAYSHTSVALRDALATFKGPIIEVHISNIHARESFRHHSFVSAVATGVICGCGIQGYGLGVQRVGALLQAKAA